MFESEMTIYCDSQCDDQAIEDAKNHIKKNGWTFEQVRIVRNSKEELLYIKWR